MKFKSVCRSLFALVVVCILISGCCLTASARTPYHDYTYFSNSGMQQQSYAQPTSPSYDVETVIDWESLGLDLKLSKISDIFEWKDDLYVLDSGNSRVIVIGLADSKYEVKRIVTIKKDGEEIKLGNGQGIFVDADGRILIAVHDTGSIADKGDTESALIGMVYVCDNEGNIQHTINAPDSDVIPDGIQFRPINVVVNEHGQYFVLVDGSTRGTYKFSPDFEFLGFFGSQRVQVTLELYLEQAWRLILSDEQVKADERIVPTVFVNFDLSEDGFFYTIANPGEVLTTGNDHVMKLNSLSTNVLRNVGRVYGDPFVHVSTGGTDKTVFTDIAVDNDGFMYCLDVTRGRVFIYDQDSAVLGVMGAKSTSDTERQWGTFASPCAVEVYQDRVLVADDTNNTITVFRETDLMKNLRVAVKLTDEGFYEEAGPYWKNVLKYDSISGLANEGMSRYYNTLGDYSTAMEYAKRAYAQHTYSEIYKTSRDEALNKYFPFIMIGVVIVVLVPIFFTQRRLKKRRSQDEYVKKYNKYTYPMYCAMHPFKGFADLKYEKKYSVPIATLIVFMIFVAQVLYSTSSGFIWNPRVADITNINMLATFMTTVGVFVLYVICNWAVTTLFNGEGKFTEIWCFTAYAMIPFVIMRIPMIILSNFFTEDEMAFLSIVGVLMYIWLAATILMATMEVHQYSFMGTILALVVTVLAMVIVVCIAAIIYSLMLQMISFVTNLSNEIALRL